MSSVGFRLLLITDGFDDTTPARVAAALGALPPGLAAVQLRAKLLTARQLFDATLALRAVTQARETRLIVNDRADIARAAGADGVHLPADGLPADAARQWLGDGFLVGASTHAVDEALAAARAGAHYVTFGPVFATASKPGATPVGLETLAAAARALPVPLFALGGVDASRAGAVVAAGARVACIGAVLGQADAAAGARSLLAAIG